MCRTPLLARQRTSEQAAPPSPDHRPFLPCGVDSLKKSPERTPVAERRIRDPGCGPVQQKPDGLPRLGAIVAKEGGYGPGRLPERRQGLVRPMCSDSRKHSAQTQSEKMTNSHY